MPKGSEKKPSPLGGKMKKSLCTLIVMMVFFIFLFCTSGCKSPVQPSNSDDDGNGDVNLGIVTADYIELNKITRISKFRSGVGHDYSDSSETCRSKKHYFVPQTYPVKIFSPVSGSITYLTQEWAGTQVGIQAGNRTFVIFHVDVSSSLAVGSSVSAGQEIGTHIGPQTWSDIAVWENDKLLSYFELMTDSVFQNYQSRGISSRDQLIISQADRDADPLTCNGETFQSAGTIPNWVDLN
jgi:hypothetical protein